MLSGLYWRWKRNGKADSVHIFQVSHNLFPFTVQSYSYTSYTCWKKRFTRILMQRLRHDHRRSRKGRLLVSVGWERNIFERSSAQGTYTSHRLLCICVSVRGRLHQTSLSMLRQLSDDASDTVLIENNGVTQKWIAIPCWSDFIAFDKNSIAGVITELL